MALKAQVKNLLVRFGPWYPLSLARQTPGIIRWMHSGCSGPAPHSVKMMVVGSYLRKYSPGHFIETGTYLGETLGYVARTGVRCSSIELSQELYEAARERFRGVENVKLLQGDSGQVLPELLRELDEPALFWLDGHYSAGTTAKGDAETPISTELRAILSHPIKRHVILIDDARCFDGAHDYPHIDELLHEVREDRTYAAEVSLDIVRLAPRR